MVVQFIDTLDLILSEQYVILDSVKSKSHSRLCLGEVFCQFHPNISVIKPAKYREIQGIAFPHRTKTCPHEVRLLVGHILSKKVWPWNTTWSRSGQGRPNPKNKHFVLFLWPLSTNSLAFKLHHSLWEETLDQSTSATYLSKVVYLVANWSGP